MNGYMYLALFLAIPALFSLLEDLGLISVDVEWGPLLCIGGIGAFLIYQIIKSEKRREHDDKDKPE